MANAWPCRPCCAASTVVPEMRRDKVSIEYWMFLLSLRTCSHWPVRTRASGHEKLRPIRAHTKAAGVFPSASWILFILPICFFPTDVLALRRDLRADSMPRNPSRAVLRRDGPRLFRVCNPLLPSSNTPMSLFDIIFPRFTVSW